jgi:hypothetical protein
MLDFGVERSVNRAGGSDVERSSLKFSRIGRRWYSCEPAIALRATPNSTLGWAFRI